jgi:hypothetical protein
MSRTWFTRRYCRYLNRHDRRALKKASKLYGLFAALSLTLASHAHAQEDPAQLAKKYDETAYKALSPEKFDPQTPNTISSVELKILDAITTLSAIKISEDDLAEEQSEERTNPLPSLAKDQIKDNAKDLLWKLLRGQKIDELFTLGKQAEILKGSIYHMALQPTATSEGLKESNKKTDRKIAPATRCLWQGA